MTPPKPPALWSKHRSIALGIAQNYRLPGGDADDVRQEALIALWVASRSYDPALGVPFKPFASMVIHRRLGSAVKAATRGKHGPLNDSLRGEVVNDEGDTVRMVEQERDVRADDELEQRERLRQILAALPSLSAAEREGIAAVLNGEPYWECKRLDNAVYRARVKLRRVAA